MRVIVRMWNKDGYHKDVAMLNEQQVLSYLQGMECKIRHLEPPLDASRIVVDPKMFPEASEFEVIVQRDGNGGAR